MSPDESDQTDCWSELGPDSPLNWNFDKVSDEDIIACCLWEYARESESIAMQADLQWSHVRHIVHRKEYARDPALAKEHDEWAARIEQRAKRAGFDYDAFFDAFWATDYAHLEIYEAITKMVGEEAQTWQRLPENIRIELSKKVNKSVVLRPLVPATVGELEELWRINSAHLLEVRSQIRSENDDSEDAPLWAETESVEPFATEDGSLKERVTLALTVDFSRFSDRELMAEFERWLRERRPVQWKQPRRVFPGARQKGRKLSEYRVALERLGLMRLLHFRTPGQVQEELPQAWGKIGCKEQDFRREIREACKFFHCLFPFLPPGEHPFSKERCGIWLPPILKYMDEMDRKMEANRGKK